MAEKPTSNHVSSAASSKATGNPALRMMGRSIGEGRVKNRLINKTHRTSKFQIQATFSQLADLLDSNWLLHFDAAVRPIS